LNRIGCRILWVFSIFAVLLIAATAAPVSAQDSAANSFQQGLDESALLERIAGGGLVFLFRHGATGPDSDRPDAISGRQSLDGSPAERQAAYFDCERQRLLSNKGKDGLRQTAKAMRSIGLLVGEVFASPMCRTRETAWLLVGQVRSSDALIGPPNAERDRLVTTIPGDGSNRILVSHSYVISNILSTPDNLVDGEFVPRGSCVVLQPNGDGDFRILAMLDPDDWTRLVQLVQW
jgi:phosphohistidine phosphatase SixA